MSADIGPGDFVECTVTHGLGNGHVEAGKVYRVATMETRHSSCSDCGRSARREPIAIQLGGVPNPHHPLLGEGRWCLCHFKPIYRPKEGAFDHLLTPVDVKSPEPA